MLYFALKNYPWDPQVTLSPHKNRLLLIGLPVPEKCWIILKLTGGAIDLQAK